MYDPSRDYGFKSSSNNDTRGLSITYFFALNLFSIFNQEVILREEDTWKSIFSLHHNKFTICGEDYSSRIKGKAFQGISLVYLMEKLLQL